MRRSGIPQVRVLRSVVSVFLANESQLKKCLFRQPVDIEVGIFFGTQTDRVKRTHDAEDRAADGYYG